MRKLAKFLLMVAIALPILASCNKEDGPRQSVLATIQPFWNEAGFTILLDNGETMYPSRMMVNYKAPKEPTRAIILFSNDNPPVDSYTYSATIYGITDLETKEIDRASSSSDNLGKDGIKILNAFIGGGYINIEFAVNIDPYSQKQQHVISLVDNKIGGEPEYTTHYPLEFRFKRDHELEEGAGTTVSSIACFHIGNYDLGHLGCDGYELKFLGLEKNEDGEMQSVKLNPTE